MLKASGTERYYFAGTVLDGETVVIVEFLVLYNQDRY